ncbi:MAG: TonB-dependent receptor [Alphaproteobacteria bacterium]|nr:TonB-dependent receptor [Alphaproteobacteria bacterium]
MLSKKLRLVALSTAAIIAPVSAALAQEVLEGIVIDIPAAPGGGVIPIDKVPGGVTVVDSETISGNTRNDIQDVLSKKVPGVLLIDAGGSNVRSQLDYRGFGAGSITGFPQGLAVYQNGIRVNEVFGDVVNWDLIPSNGISDITVVSGNPIYGLNALGGAGVIRMKDGFEFQGVEIEGKFGSYGYKEIGTQIGISSGPWALYFAGQHIDEDGWRDFSPTSVDRMYADLGAKGSRVEAHFNLTWAKTSAGVTAATPEELLNIDHARTFTSPQVTDLEVLMPSVNAKVDVTETLTVSGLAYYRRYKSSVIDGNVLEAEGCGEVAAEALGFDDDNLTPGQQETIAGVLARNNVTDENICAEEGVEGDTPANLALEALAMANGELIEEDDVGDEPFGIIDRINQKAESWGGSLQAVEKMQVFSRPNQFLVGVSYDKGSVRYKTSSEIGTIEDRYVVDGADIIVTEPDDFTGRDVDVETEYIGVYFSNTLDVTDALAVTVGGRFNHASVDLVDLTGEFDGITSSHSFDRFNPNVGATYKFIPGFQVYGGYSEANRAPTPAELACANPDNPCPIESFLTDDPPLDQVISRTVEAGVRGELNSTSGDQKFTYGVGYFRTLNQDDIVFVNSNVTGRGFFLNGGDTLRQGIEARATYSWKERLSLYAGYAWVRATFEDALEFQSPAHPFAGPCSNGGDDDICIQVQPGDRLTNIPEHRFKAGFEYMITQKWMFGADMIASTGQFHLGDEINVLPKVGGYTRVDLKSTYQVTDEVQLFGIVNNVFDRRYGLFGTLFEADEAPTEPAGQGPNFQFNNPRSIVPSAPVSAYGGVKVRF